MAVPMLDLRAQYARIKDEIDRAVADVFETQCFVGGPYVEGLENAIAEYLGEGRVLGVASGTDALLLLLKAMELQPGDEVITTAFSFFATAGAIVNAGGTPVFVDVDPVTFSIDTAQIEAHVTERTRAIIPVHPFGQCADMAPIAALAAKHGIRVIEDAAQSFGARHKDRLACTLGDAAAVSFYPTKNLGGAGDGGVAVCRDDSLAERVALLRAHGAGRTYFHTIVGTNSRLDALQAAVVLTKLKYIDQWNEERRAKAAYYDQRLAEVAEVVTPVALPENDHVYHQYVIRIPKRDEALARLREQGIGCAVFYPLPLPAQECFSFLGCDMKDFPEAEKACSEVLALPMFPELTESQIDEVVEALKAHLTAI